MRPSESSQPTDAANDGEDDEDDNDDSCQLDGRLPVASLLAAIMRRPSAAFPKAHRFDPV